ncbi:MAG: hypothetical protein QNJ44_13530 [Rhodobacter sp.]|nr:hypothetical protein [Rhodobacter sp.]
MIGAVLLTFGFLVAIATICGVLAAFIGHGYLWHLFPRDITSTASGATGGVVCAAMVFGFLWTLNPDPPERDGPPSVGGTATMTTFSGLFWLPLYLYAFNAIARRRRSEGE